MSNGTRPPPMPIAYNDFYKTNGNKYEVMTVGPSMTRQEFAEECDINSIMKRYETTGFLPPMEGVVPSYVDWTAVPPDLMSGMEIMKEAEASFMQLPARVRKEFDNDAFSFVGFATDPANLEQMRVWGLAPPSQVNVAPTAAGGPPTAAVQAPATPVAAPGTAPPEAPKAS